VTLAERLLAEQGRLKTKRHVVDVFLEQLDDAERAEWVEALHCVDLAHTTLTKALKDEGVEVSHEHVGTWRRKQGVNVR